MKILCITSSDSVEANVQSVLTGQDVSLCGNIQSAVDLLQSHVFQVVLYDTSEAEDVQAGLLMLRREAQNYIYVALMSDDLAVDDSFKSGANALLPLQTAQGALEGVLSQAEALFEALAVIGDESHDFPSAGGVIARSAFYQLFLSGVDRAGRYGEQSFALFINLSNYDELFSIGGPYVADFAAAALSRRLVGMRRQSDIIGQISKHMYALLLQRPSYADEPLEAAKRFVKSLEECVDIAEGAPVPIQIEVSLLSIPSGEMLYETLIKLEKAS